MNGSRNRILDRGRFGAQPAVKVGPDAGEGPGSSPRDEHLSCQSSRSSSRSHFESSSFPFPFRFLYLISFFFCFPFHPFLCPFSLSLWNKGLPGFIFVQSKTFWLLLLLLLLLLLHPFFDTFKEGNNNNTNNSSSGCDNNNRRNYYYYCHYHHLSNRFSPIREKEKKFE